MKKCVTTLHPQYTVGFWGRYDNGILDFEDDLRMISRLDFEDVLLQQPNNNRVGICGGTGDSITVQNTSTSMNGFNSLNYKYT